MYDFSITSPMCRLDHLEAIMVTLFAFGCDVSSEHLKFAQNGFCSLTNYSFLLAGILMFLKFFVLNWSLPDNDFSVSFINFGNMALCMCLCVISEIQIGSSLSKNDVFLMKMSDVHEPWSPWPVKMNRIEVRTGVQHQLHLPLSIRMTTKDILPLKDGRKLSLLSKQGMHYGWLEMLRFKDDI